MKNRILLTNRTSVKQCIHLGVYPVYAEQWSHSKVQQITSIEQWDKLSLYVGYEFVYYSEDGEPTGTLANERALAPMRVKGHLASNGRIQGHSAGAIFPIIIRGKGNPFEEGCFKWEVVLPNGYVVAAYTDILNAMTLGTLIKLGLSDEQPSTIGGA